MYLYDVTNNVALSTQSAKLHTRAVKAIAAHTNEQTHAHFQTQNPFGVHITGPLLCFTRCFMGICSNEHDMCEHVT